MRLRSKNRRLIRCSLGRYAPVRIAVYMHVLAAQIKLDTERVYVWVMSRGTRSEHYLTISDADCDMGILLCHKYESLSVHLSDSMNYWIFDRPLACTELM